MAMSLFTATNENTWKIARSPHVYGSSQRLSHIAGSRLEKSSIKASFSPSSPPDSKLPHLRTRRPTRPSPSTFRDQITRFYHTFFRDSKTLDP